MRVLVLVTSLAVFLSCAAIIIALHPRIADTAPTPATPQAPVLCFEFPQAPEAPRRGSIMQVGTCTHPGNSVPALAAALYLGKNLTRVAHSF